MADTRKSHRAGGKGRKGKAASRQDRTVGVQLIAAAGAAVALGATALAVFFTRRKGVTNPAEHAVPDLAADAPVPGTNRAPDAFRPDPTAPVPPELRESLRPATGPAPSLAADRGSTIQ
ncbi:hypothetical protein GCM10011380_13860 [Sphingomonas metalli]|uniref:Uncharacterized protein n=1 Tax=Sphingomonas metalli TaxID=1779358 RepID=A0A916SZR9_9SPHN|nr:hypothetical protein [Sphingomonas metalli]GGB25535.1 hypothetical protein GCM10011380_13860 [Sphingomonas metalli]